MSTYDQIVEEGIIKGLIKGRQEGQEEAFRAMLRIAYKQGIDIEALARQYSDLPADRVQRIVDEVKTL